MHVADDAPVPGQNSGQGLRGMIAPAQPLIGGVPVRGSACGDEICCRRRRTQLSYVVHCGTFASQVCDLLDPGGPAADV